MVREISSAKIGNYGFDEIYSKHYEKIVNSMRLRYGFSREVAKDIVQDAFMKAYEKRHQFEARSHPSAWIWGIARYGALNYLRRLQARKHKTSYDERFHGIERLIETHKKSEPENELPELTEMAKQIKQPMPRRIFELHYIEDKTYKEIAKELGMQSQTVRQNAFRAKRILIAIYNPKMLEE